MILRIHIGYIRLQPSNLALPRRRFFKAILAISICSLRNSRKNEQIARAARCKNSHTYNHLWPDTLPTGTSWLRRECQLPAYIDWRLISKFTDRMDRAAQRVGQVVLRRSRSSLLACASLIFLHLRTRKTLVLSCAAASRMPSSSALDESTSVWNCSCDVALASSVELTRSCPL